MLCAALMPEVTSLVAEKKKWWSAANLRERARWQQLLPSAKELGRSLRRVLLM